MLDHLVYATPDLDAAVDDLEARLGVRAVLGGRHPGRGTYNALISLGADHYLEIIGPDPEQPEVAQPRGFGLDDLTVPQLRTWAAKAPDIDARIERARVAGYDPGPALAMSRERPDGVTLAWHLTPSGQSEGGWLVPFLIDWGGSPHPALTAPGGVTLDSLRAEHPTPDAIRPLLAALDVALDVDAGPEPRLIARLRTAGGVVELR
ncbi:MAG TPA: VOC family protein [Dehalococcoidia bacterium]|nr:VOC family protein [Dehalococcoidia bacterium]